MPLSSRPRSWPTRLGTALCLVLAALAGAAHPLAGQAAFGVKGGMALSNMGGGAVGNIQGRTGLTLTAFTDLARGAPTSLQLEVTFTQRGAVQQGQLDLGGGLTVARGTWDYDYLDFAMLLKRKFDTGPTTRIAFYGGPSLAWLLAADWPTPIPDFELPDLTRSTDFATVVGVSIEAVGGLLLDMRYGLGLVTIDQGRLQQRFQRKHRSVTATVGILFG